VAVGSLGEDAAGQSVGTYLGAEAPRSTSAHGRSPAPKGGNEVSAVGRHGDLAVELARLYRGRRRRPRVLLFGNYGRGNLGDEGILASVLVSLRPVSDVIVASRAPATVSAQHGVDAVQMMSLRGVFALLRCDAVAIGGGGMFGNGINLMTSLLPVSALLSQKLGKETLFLATGAYSSSPSWVQRCLRKVAASSVLVSVRDEESAAVLGRGVETVIVDDPAINLTPASEDMARVALGEAGVRLDRPLLGISLKPTRYEDRNNAQVAAATVASEWWSRTLGGECVLLCLSGRGDNGLGSKVSDRTLAEQVLSFTSVPESVYRFGPDVRAELMKAAIGQCELVVGHRLHAQIYAWSMGVPLAGISYERKSDSFLEARQLKRIDLWTLDPVKLVEWISAMVAKDQLAAD
jgi:polysaccharide pyruvyl transferase WcaK-like protein